MSVVFPPWGQLDRRDQEDLVAGPPTDWDQPNSVWIPWRDNRAEEISDFLWPIYEPSVGWKGKAAANIEPLTVADLELMLHIQSMRPLQNDIESPERSENCPKHGVWLEQEDIFKPFFGSLHLLYDKTMPQKNFPIVEEYFRFGLKSKLGSSSLQWKNQFQRPRPHQMAMILGSRFSQLKHENAKSSLTPSLSSGHCLQGLLAVGAVIERFFDQKLAVNPSPTLECLLQFAIDIGDRRVMAGVHYPSDNIASWYLALCLSDRVFHNPAVKGCLYNAIKTKSFVHAQLASVPYFGPMLSRIDQAALSPASIP